MTTAAADGSHVVALGLSLLRGTETETARRTREPILLFVLGILNVSSPTGAVHNQRVPITAHHCDSPKARRRTAPKSVAAEASPLPYNIVRKAEQADDWPSPEVSQQHGDAADEPFRELVRRTTREG